MEEGFAAVAHVVMTVNGLTCPLSWLNYFQTRAGVLTEAVPRRATSTSLDGTAGETGPASPFLPLGTLSPGRSAWVGCQPEPPRRPGILSAPSIPGLDAGLFWSWVPPHLSKHSFFILFHVSAPGRSTGNSAGGITSGQIQEVPPQGWAGPTLGLSTQAAMVASGLGSGMDTV